MNLGLLALHVVVGLLFFAHGAQKLFGLYGGPGIDGTAGMMDSLGMHPPRLHALAAGLAETVGGILLALGLFTPIGAALVIAVMVTAILTVHRPKGLFVTNGGYEYNLTLIAAAFALAAAGPGQWSLDHALGLDWAGAGWGLIALAAGLLGGIGAIVQGHATSASHSGQAPPSPA